MRIFKTKAVVRFAKSERIEDSSLVEAIARAERGLIDADLGGGMIKQRIARAGQGRSGGYRMLVGVCWADRAVFVFGFAKSDLANIGEKQLATIRDIAAIWLKADEEALALAAAAGQLTEVHHDG